MSYTIPSEPKLVLEPKPKPKLMLEYDEALLAIEAIEEPKD